MQTRRDRRAAAGRENAYAFGRNRREYGHVIRYGPRVDDAGDGAQSGTFLRFEAEGIVRTDDRQTATHFATRSGAAGALAYVACRGMIADGGGLQVSAAGPEPERCHVLDVRAGAAKPDGTNGTKSPVHLGWLQFTAAGLKRPVLRKDGTPFANRQSAEDAADYVRGHTIAVERDEILMVL